MPYGQTRARRTRRAAVVDEVVLQRVEEVRLLSEDVGLEVVQVCSTLRQLLGWLRQTPHERWPHLVVVHLPIDSESLPDLHLLGALRDAGIRVVASISPTARSIARRVSGFGALAILSTADGPDEFVRAAQTVLAGGTLFTPRVRASLRPPQDSPRLGAQEARVLGLYASGMTVAEAARTMGIQHETARKYLARVRDKYTKAGRAARTKLDLAEIARIDGYIDPGLPGTQSPRVVGQEDDDT